MFGKGEKKEPLTRKELPYTIAMVVLDIIAPILLMSGITRTNSANVSLLNNFEIVATSLIALIIFKEVIGSLLVLGACICWGFENNCTKMISNKSSEEIVVIKGIFSGLGSVIIALIIGENIPSIKYILDVLLLGFVAYGLSINFYIMAQKDLGAAKTSAYYSIAPFLGVAFSIILLGERPSWQFYVALGIIIISTFMMIKDTDEGVSSVKK